MERIFIRELLIKALDPSKLSFECYELLARRPFSAPYTYGDPHAEIHFMIIDVHGDEGVLTTIKERERSLIEGEGYNRIIGLRDMYSEAYVKLSPEVIDGDVSNEFIRKYNLTIQKMTKSSRIKLFFAIMEVEAWFLGMYNLFGKIDSMLTSAHIEEKLNIDLRSVDPQSEFYRPSEIVHLILELCGRGYGKKEDEIESICRAMSMEDYDDARKSDRCKSFDDFYRNIVNCS